MDIQPQQPISDDQELAKVLAGITAGADNIASSDLASGLDEEATVQADNASGAAAPALDTAIPVTVSGTSDSGIDSIESTVATEPISISTPSPIAPSTPPVEGGLETIKHDALNELRPLVDKLNISAQEKFDTYLLLIRSTDDATLVSPAFEAARAIPDESGKAQALLDIVKEIDYLSNPQK